MPIPAAFRGRRERQVDSTRARIFRAALAAFRRVGFSRASVTEIAREAGVSRPTFYAHYPTKDHVLLELEWLQERALVERVQRARSLREALHEMTEGLLEMEAQLGDSDLFRDMFRVYAQSPADLPLEEQPFPIVAAVARHFREAAARGELRAGLEPGAATRACLLSVFGHLSGPSRTADERRADLAVLFSLFLGEAGAEEL